MLKFLKKWLFSALCISVVSSTCFAQDIIITKDSKKISAKILRIAEDNVRYKDYNDQDGPSYTLLKKGISSILYENGEVETFDSAAESSTQTQTQEPATVTNNTGKNSSLIKGKATVYIIRNSSIGSLIKMSVECNGMKIGSTKAKQYVYTVLDPGDFTFTSKTPENSGTLNITVEPGNTYYIKQQVKMGIVVARTGLELMNDADGIKALNSCNLSSDNLYVMPENNDDSYSYNRDNEDLPAQKTVDNSNQMSVQNDETTMKGISNGTLEILALNLPDSVIYKPAEGQVFESGTVSEYLVYNTTNILAKERRVSGTVMLSSENGNTTWKFGDQSRVVAIFDLPEGFKAQKIKFVVAGKEMYYNIAKSNWEK